MAKLISFKTHSDKRGSLTVLEKNIPFKIRRVFYIYDVDHSKRGFHKHKKTIQLAICISGNCDIVIKNSENNEKKFKMRNPNEGLLLEPNDFHWMENFTPGAVLLVLASEEFDKNDYIYSN